MPNAEQQGECYPALAPDPCSALTGLSDYNRNMLCGLPPSCWPQWARSRSSLPAKYVPQMRCYTQLRCTFTGDIVPVTLQRPNDEAGEEAEASRQLDECALAHCKRVAACTSPCCHLQAMLESGASLCTAAQRAGM